jgi:hypothetical protein
MHLVKVFTQLHARKIHKSPLLHGSTHRPTTPIEPPPPLFLQIVARRPPQSPIFSFLKLRPKKPSRALAISSSKPYSSAFEARPRSLTLLLIICPSPSPSSVGVATLAPLQRLSDASPPTLPPSAARVSSVHRQPPHLRCHCGAPSR